MLLFLSKAKNGLDNFICLRLSKAILFYTKAKYLAAYKPLFNIHLEDLLIHRSLGWFVLVSTYLPSQHPFVQLIILHGSAVNRTKFYIICAILISLTNNELYLTLKLAVLSKNWELTTTPSFSLYSSQSQF